MKKVKSRKLGTTKVKYSKLESFMYTLTVLLVFAAPFGIVFFKATLSKVNIEVERTKREIRTQEKKNESLEMKINELASLDKVIEVAQEEGLSYNNDNIKVIE
jgi:cell division protein FtsL